MIGEYAGTDCWVKGAILRLIFVFGWCCVGCRLLLYCLW